MDTGIFHNIHQFESFKSGLKRSILMVLVVIFNYCVLFGQTYTLEQVIRFARENSTEALRIKTSKENKYWQWKTYKAEYKPQLILKANLPSYQNKNTAVTQDDGSIEFRNINQNEVNAELSLEQNIGLTGGKIFISSDFNRLDDFKQNTGNYSGSPFYIGIEQPLFVFNDLKWMNRIEPLKYEESHKEFIEENEKIAYNTTVKYFNLLISQINYQVAYTNKANADTIYNVGIEKYALGKISKNELLQLKYGVISAQKSIATARLSIKTTLLELCSYTGLNEIDTIVLALPDSIFRFYIDDSLAISKAMKNSLRSVEFKREVLEARRDAEQARRESGLNANLSISYGKTNAASDIYGMYENPQNLQTLDIELSIPIFDWGRTKAKRKTAEGDLELVKYTVQQDKINFRQEVISEIENFRMLQEFVEYTAEADCTATSRFEIARLRYMASDISLTEYNIALEEKDQAKWDYIEALRDYWLAYHSIRILTLYDFNNHQQIIY